MTEIIDVKPAHSWFKKCGVTRVIEQLYFNQTFVQGGGSILQMNICAEKHLIANLPNVARKNEKKILLFFFITLINFSFAQDGETPLPFVQHEPLFDTAPRFPGGPHALMKYIEDSIRYPEPEKTKGIQGNVYMKFNVTQEGKITNVKAVNGVTNGPNLVKEAERLLHTMPLWIPASKNGKPVEAEYTLSIPFKLKKTNIPHK